MVERSSDELSWEIPQIGWQLEQREKLIKALSEFRRKSADHLLKISLLGYLELQGEICEVKKLRGYCYSFHSQQVQKDMCLLTIDIQRQNLGFESVVNLKYTLKKNEVTLEGLAIK